MAYCTKRSKGCFVPNSKKGQSKMFWRPELLSSLFGVFT
jgi:hypothetical protein